jgi:hypothetical protein
MDRKGLCREYSKIPATAAVRALVLGWLLPRHQQLELHIQIHAGRAVETKSAAWIAMSAYWPLAPGFSAAPRKSTEFFGTKVQSSSRMEGFSSQSFSPARPNQTTWVDSPYPLAWASLVSSGPRALVEQEFHPAFPRRGTRRSATTTEPLGNSSLDRATWRRVRFGVDCSELDLVGVKRWIGWEDASHGEAGRNGGGHVVNWNSRAADN